MADDQYEEEREGAEEEAQTEDEEAFAEAAADEDDDEQATEDDDDGDMVRHSTPSMETSLLLNLFRIDAPAEVFMILYIPFIEIAGGRCP